MSLPKIRAWDKESKFMTYGSIEYFDDSIGYRFEHFTVGSDFEVEFMQSTGLKDKNGVEIFEGDILKIIEVTNETMEEYLTDVAWEDASFVIKSKGVDYYDTFLAAWSGDPNKTYPLFELEVVGNIYQNPELLKEVGQ